MPAASQTAQDIALSGQAHRRDAGFKRHRVWLESVDLFKTDAKRVEVLSLKGKAALDETVTELLKFPRNGPLMIEGFGGKGTPSQQHLSGRRRAVRVKGYIVDRFHFRPAYVGIVSMEPEAPDGDPGGFKEGVAVVAFYSRRRLREGAI